MPNIRTIWRNSTGSNYCNRSDGYDNGVRDVMVYFRVNDKLLRHSGIPKDGLDRLSFDGSVDGLVATLTTRANNFSKDDAVKDYTVLQRIPNIYQLVTNPD